HQVTTIDGERESDRELAPHWKVSTAGYQDLRSLIDNLRLYPILRSDPLIPTLKFPHHGGPGAGTSRAVGVMKFAAAVEPFKRQVLATAHAALRDFPGTLEVVQLTTVMGICGGTASGLAIPALLVARDVIRQHAPGANIRVHVHALNHTCFEAVVSDR